MYSFSKEELKAIKDNNTDYFNNYAIEKQQEFLYEAISVGKIKLIKYFIDKGIEVKNKTCLGLLAEKKNKVDIFEYIYSKNISLSENGGYPFFRACLHNRSENAEYLSNHIPEKSAAVSRALNCIINKAHSQTKDQSITVFEDTLKILLKKSSTQMLDVFSNNPNKEIDNNYKYALNLYYDIHLENKSHRVKTVKI